MWIKEHVGETRSTVGTRRYFAKSHLKPNSNYHHQDEIIKWLAFWISTFPRCYVTKQFSIQWFSASHLSKWAWNKGYNWHWKVCFVHKDGQLRTSNAKLYHKSNDFTFLIVNSPFNSSTDVWSCNSQCIFIQLYGLCPLKWFSGASSAADAKATQARLCFS